MKNCNIGDILKSPAVTILVGTICIAFLMSQTNNLIRDIKYKRNL